MTVKVYPNKLTLDTDGLCDTYTTDRRMTVTEWLEADGGVPPGVSVTLNEEIIDRTLWDTTVFRPRDDLVICVEPKGTDPFSITVALFVGVKAVFAMLMPALPGTPKTPGSGDSISDASAKGNKVKLGDPIRESFGLQKIYPDYLLPPHKYFSDPRKQQIELCLCIGKGDFQVNSNNVRIGDTPLISLGAEAEYHIYSPGQSLAGDNAALWWHQAAEVGSSSTGAAGLDLTASTSITPALTASSLVFNGYTVTIPTGAGTVPSDWTVGLVLRIVAPYTYTVTDGAGGTRDTVSGPLGMLNPTPGDLIEVAGSNAGTYQVETFNSSGPSMTLNFVGGAPATGLVLGSGLASIGPVGLLFRITGKTSSSITVDRLKSSGATDTSFPGWTAQTTSSGSITLDGSSLEGGWRGPFSACPDGAKTSIIQWDIFFPQGLVKVNSNGSPELITCQVELQYRDFALSGAWTSVVQSLTLATYDQVGYTFNTNLPYAMRPEVRMRKVSPLTEATTVRADVQWYGLKALLPAPSSYAGVSVLTARIQTSDRIAAQTESLVHVIGTRVLPTRLGGVWQTARATRDIAPAVIYVAKSLGYQDSDLDLAEFDRLGDGIWYSRADHFDQALASESTAKEVINNMLGAGFAELTLDRGVIRPVRDEPRSVFEHMYSPQNMTESLKRDIAMPSPDDYDGVQVTYTDQATWAETTVDCQLPGEVTGRKIEKVTAPGVIDRDKAYQFGMRRRSAQVYRRDQFSWSTEMDALNSRYMSYCAVCDDVPGYGQSAILLAGTTGAVVTLESSEPLDWSAPGPYLAALRRPDGTVSGPYPATRIDDYLFTVPGVDFVPDTDWVYEPPHIMFGPSIRWTYPVLVTKVSPKGTTSASVDAIGYDARVYLFDDEPAP